MTLQTLYWMLPHYLLHTRLCNFVRNIPTNISALGHRTHLKPGELSSLSIAYNITIFGLYPLQSFWFYFLLRDSAHTLLEFASLWIIKDRKPEEAQIVDQLFDFWFLSKRFFNKIWASKLGLFSTVNAHSPEYLNSSYFSLQEITFINTTPLKVKNDHRSKFSNLSNWKEEAWKNGIRTRDLCDTGAMLYQLSYEATHWELPRSKVIRRFDVSNIMPIKKN